MAARHRLKCEADKRNSALCARRLVEKYYERARRQRSIARRAAAATRTTASWRTIASMRGRYCLKARRGRRMVAYLLMAGSSENGKSAPSLRPILSNRLAGMSPLRRFLSFAHLRRVDIS